MQTIHYLFVVIGRDDPDQCGVTPSVWDKHPDWNYFVRTDQKYEIKGVTYNISGGGSSRREAIQSAEGSILAAKSRDTIQVRSGGMVISHQAEVELNGREVSFEELPRS